MRKVNLPALLGMVDTPVIILIRDSFSQTWIKQSSTGKVTVDTSSRRITVTSNGNIFFQGSLDKSISIRQSGDTLYLRSTAAQSKVTFGMVFRSLTELKNIRNYLTELIRIKNMTPDDFTRDSQSAVINSSSTMKAIDTATLNDTSMEESIRSLLLDPLFPSFCLKVSAAYNNIVTKK
ncbi:hypothetical protein P9112_002422 [Eukaryota sp. TZLM1-RC]